jgi:hypothetical protein
MMGAPNGDISSYGDNAGNSTPVVEKNEVPVDNTPVKEEN